jgi:hypothetical protein
MVKFRIAEEEKEEKTIDLKLLKEKGRISLIATDEDGNEWYLLEFKEGKVYLCEGVDEDLGLPVDDVGHIMFETE